MKTLSEMQSGLHRHQNRELFERTLNNDEIEALIDKARESALAIQNDKKRNKEERKQAQEVLDFISDVEGIWDEKKSLHPSQVVSLMKIVAGTSSPIQQDGVGRQKGSLVLHREKFHRTSLMKN